MARGSDLPEKITSSTCACGFFFLVVSEGYIHSQTAGLPIWVDDVFYILVTSAIIYFLVRATASRAFRAKESELRESEDRLARILETNASGVVVFDAEGKITFANHMACRILGVDRERIIGRRYDDPVWDMTDADGRSDPAGGKSRGEGPGHRDAGARRSVRVRRADGSRVFLSENAAPLLDARAPWSAWSPPSWTSPSGRRSRISRSASSFSPWSRALPPSSSRISTGTWSTRTTGTR